MIRGRFGLLFVSLLSVIHTTATYTLTAQALTRVDCSRLGAHIAPYQAYCASIRPQRPERPTRYTMSDTRNIVFLGASYAGISATHYFLKHVYPHLPASSTIKYKVILINASPKWYQRHASPRAIANTLLMPNEKIFLDIEPGFKQYGDKAKFLVGKATSWDPEKRVLFITEPSGKEISVSYHALVLATGSKSPSAVWSSFGNGHEEIEAALADANAQVKGAKSIVIAGGGPAGVETAGEIADYLNGTPGWFQKRPKNPKAHITLITSSDKLLPRLRPAIAKQAEHDLNRLGVEVQYNTKVRLPVAKILISQTDLRTDHIILPLIRQHHPNQTNPLQRLRALHRPLPARPRKHAPLLLHPHPPPRPSQTPPNNRINPPRPPHRRPSNLRPRRHNLLHHRRHPRNPVRSPRAGLKHEARPASRARREFVRETSRHR